MQRIVTSILVIILSLFLASCGSSDDTETINSIYHYLTETVEAEANFEQYQNELNELEQKEQQIYNEVISLGNEEEEEMNELIDEALTILDERLEKINSIQAMLEESKKEFENIEPLTLDVEDEEKLSYLEKMQKTMMSRYTSYEVVFDVYVDSIQLTKELYQAFQNEGQNVGEVYALIDTVNDSYEEIIEANEQFNKETVLYNELKKAFYDLLNESNEEK